jgi:hypothetical protein
MRFLFCIILCIYPHDGHLMTKTYSGTTWNDACVMIRYDNLQVYASRAEHCKIITEKLRSNVQQQRYFFLVYENLPWVPLVESPKAKWRKSFQQPKRFSLPTWWFVWRKINIILPRCVDYTIERYNRWSIYNFEFIYIEKLFNLYNRRMRYCMVFNWNFLHV